MVAKTSPARRRAFFAALAATGNYTIAAARAKVSRSWVQLHRSTDPEFRDACTAAVAAARARLQAAGGSAGLPPGLRFLAGEELVVRAGNARQVVLARARLKQWTASTEGVFLARLSATCNVRMACAAAGLSVASAYVHRQRSSDFARRWQAALEEGYERLELALVDGAIGSLEGRAPAYDDRIERISFDQAVTLLKLHKLAAIGHGVRLKPLPRASEEEVDVALGKLVDRLRRVEAAKARRAAGSGARTT
jgi:hypothetical protein